MHTIEEKQRRIRHRSAKRCWSECALSGILSSEERKIVPRPRERPALIQKPHEALRHCRDCQTAMLVSSQHWWAGLYAEGEAFVRRCGTCDWVQASFVPWMEALHPLNRNSVEIPKESLSKIGKVTPKDLLHHFQAISLCLSVTHHAKRLLCLRSALEASMASS